MPLFELLIPLEEKELSLENVDMVRAVDFKPTCTCSWLIYKRARDKIWEEKYVDSFQT